MPLKVASLELDFEQQQEQEDARAVAAEVRLQLDPIVEQAVSTARASGGQVPTLPDLGPELTRQLQTLQVAEAIIKSSAANLPASDRVILQETVQTIAAQLARPVERGEPLTQEEQVRLQALLAKAENAAERKEALTLAKRASLLATAQLVSKSLVALETKHSKSSFDSELATLWNDVPAAHLWLPNPLARRDPAAAWVTDALMVARLDGLEPAHVLRIIDDSVAVELEGLEGKLVVDSRGLRMPGAGGKPDGYAPFDEQLRQLAALLSQAATQEVVHDDLPATFARAADGTAAIADVAAYVGWYRLRDYNAPFDLARGAVAYHVASYELVSLRNPNEKGWVAGLLRDGAAASLGPTSEPFLSAFPPPTTFVPLLLTGRFTLAEVYWATVPHVSWQMALRGGPALSAVREEARAAASGPLNAMVEQQEPVRVLSEATSGR